MNRRFALIQAVFSLVALAAVVWWASKQEPPEFPSDAGSYAGWAAALVLYAIATLMRGERWHRILSPPASAPRAATAYALTAVGYMGNNVLPARAGEALKVVLLSTALRREQAHAARVGGRRADPRPARAGRDLRRRGLRRAQLERAPERPAAAHGRIAGGAAAGRGRDRALGSARPPRVRSRARLAEAARRRPARPARARRARCCSPAPSCCGRSRQPCTWPSLARSASTSARRARSTSSRSPTSSRRFPPPRGRSGTFDAAVAFGARRLGASGSMAVTYMLLLRFVLYVPITARRAGDPGRSLRRLVPPALGHAARVERRRGRGRHCAPRPRGHRHSGLAGADAGARRTASTAAPAGADSARSRPRAGERRARRPRSELIRRAGSMPVILAVCLVVAALSLLHAVHAHLRPVGLDHVGPRDRSPRPGDRGRPVVEAAADPLHRPVLALRRRHRARTCGW